MRLCKLSPPKWLPIEFLNAVKVLFRFSQEQFNGRGLVATLQDGIGFENGLISHGIVSISMDDDPSILVKMSLTAKIAHYAANFVDGVCSQHCVVLYRIICSEKFSCLFDDVLCS